MNQPRVVIAMNREILYGFSASIYRDETINFSLTSPRVSYVLEALKSPTDLLVLIPAELTLGINTPDETYNQMWHQNQHLFGYLALKHMLDNNVISEQQLHLINIAGEPSFSTHLSEANLTVPKESISQINTQSDESALLSIIQARLGLI